MLLDPVHIMVNYFLIYSSMATLVIAFVLLGWGVLFWKSPNRKKWLKRGAIFFACSLGLGAANYAWIFGVILPSFAAASRAMHEERRLASSFVRVGEIAPDFQGHDLQGEEFSLEKLHGRVVLVNFFATWCGPCLNELPHLQKIWEEFQNDDRFSMIVIGREESTENVKEFQSKQGFSFPMAADPDRAIYSRFASELIPRTFLISPDGKIAMIQTGFDGETVIQSLRNEIVAQLRTSKKLPRSARGEEIFVN